MRSLDRIARRQAGAPVSVLSAPAMSMLGQIQRRTRNDVLFTLSNAMDQASKMKFIKPETRIDGFSNLLVLAVLNGRTKITADSVSKLIETNAFETMKIAVTDNTAASGLDGRAVLDANRLTGAVVNRIIGAANTGDVAFLVTTGIADIGLVYLTDVKADPRLRVIAMLTADVALTNYSVAVNAQAVSPKAGSLLDVIRSTDGCTALRSAGLGVAA